MPIYPKTKKPTDPGDKKGKVVENNYASHFKGGMEYAKPTGEVTREDYDRFKKAWFEDNVKYGSDLGSPGANQFWNSRDMNDVKSQFDNDQTVTRIKFGNFDPFLMPKDVVNRNAFEKRNGVVYETEFTDMTPKEKPTQNEAPKLPQGPVVHFNDLYGNKTTHQNMGRNVSSRK